METMGSLQRKSLDQPDETRHVDKGAVEVVGLDAATMMRTTFQPMMRTTFQPGWRWSECLKPIVESGVIGGRRPATGAPNRSGEW